MPFSFSVTFSRIEPEGKLVMGCRKSSSTPSAHQVCSLFPKNLSYIINFKEKGQINPPTIGETASRLLNYIKFQLNLLTCKNRAIESVSG